MQASTHAPDILCRHKPCCITLPLHARRHARVRIQVDDLEIKRRFSPYVEQCVVLLKAPDVTPDLFVEVLGTLANLAVPEFDFQALAARHDLVAFLAQYAAPGAVDDDILLEVIMFLGARMCAFYFKCC